MHITFTLKSNRPDEVSSVSQSYQVHLHYREAFKENFELFHLLEIPRFLKATLGKAFISKIWNFQKLV